MEQTKVVSIVLDVLKPHDPPIPEFALVIGRVPNVMRVEVTVEERDEKTESLQVVIKGNVNFELLKTYMAREGAVIHSVDAVIVVSET